MWTININFNAKQSIISKMKYVDMRTDTPTPHYDFIRALCGFRSSKVYNLVHKLIIFSSVPFSKHHYMILSLLICVFCM
jgi:hypothetical protein